MTSLFDAPSEFHLGLLGIVAAYVAIGVILLAMNVRSRWLWWIKASAIVVTSVFFAQIYFSTVGLTGWPTFDRLPEKFQFHWAKIVPPDETVADKGVIFLWLEPLNEFNVPIGKPRAYRRPYSKELAEKLQQAQEDVKDGKEVAGTAEEMDENEQDQREVQMNADQERRDLAGGATPEDFVTDMLNMTFTEMPEVVQPEKNPF